MGILVEARLLIPTHLGSIASGPRIMEYLTGHPGFELTYLRCHSSLETTAAWMRLERVSHGHSSLIAFTIICSSTVAAICCCILDVLSPFPRRFDCLARSDDDASGRCADPNLDERGVRERRTGTHGGVFVVRVASHAWGERPLSTDSRSRDAVKSGASRGRARGGPGQRKSCSHFFFTPSLSLSLPRSLPSLPSRTAAGHGGRRRWPAAASLGGCGGEQRSAARKGCRGAELVSDSALLHTAGFGSCRLNVVFCWLSLVYFGKCWITLVFWITMLVEYGPFEPQQILCHVY